MISTNRKHFRALISVFLSANFIIPTNSLVSQLPVSMPPLRNLGMVCVLLRSNPCHPVSTAPCPVCCSPSFSLQQELIHFSSISYWLHCWPLAHIQVAPAHRGISAGRQTVSTFSRIQLWAPPSQKGLTTQRSFQCSPSLQTHTI